MDVSEYVHQGINGEASFQVEEQYTALHVGSGSLRVLATPSMIAFMERTARDLLEQNLPEGYSSVGVRIDVRHLAPSPLGETVRVRCEVLDIDGTRVDLAVQAWDSQEKIGEGRHQRVVIDIFRFLQRVEKKSERR